MKRQVPGLSNTAPDVDSEVPDGIFLVRLEGAQHRCRLKSGFICCGFPFLSPSPSLGAPSPAACIARLRQCGSWVGFCGIFSTTLNF